MYKSIKMDLQTTYIWHNKCTIYKELIYNLRRGQIFEVQIDLICSAHVQIPKAPIYKWSTIHVQIMPYGCTVLQMVKGAKTNWCTNWCTTFANGKGAKIIWCTNWCTIGKVDVQMGKEDDVQMVRESKQIDVQIDVQYLQMVREPK